jgi:predicted PurR-regulated permease PerM
MATQRLAEASARSRWVAALVVSWAVLGVVALAAFVVWALVQIRVIFPPLVLAVAVIVLLNPVVTWLQRHGVPRVLSVVALLVVIYLVLFALAASLGLAVARLATLLPTYGDQFNSLLGQATDLLERFGVGQAQISRALSGFKVTSVLGPVQSILGGLTTGLSDLLFILLLLFFLAADAAARLGLLDVG